MTLLKETLFVHSEWEDKHGLKRSERVGTLRQVVSEYTDKIRRLEDALVEANGMLRTFHHVVAREGQHTNWGGLSKNLGTLLEKQRLHINEFNGYTRDLPEASDGSSGTQEGQSK